jgi:3-dehydro-L-gulonate 2-dehydrogenase
MPVIPFSQMRSLFYDVLVKHGISVEDANQCAEIFAVNSLEGVYTHGVNRFPRFVQYIREGHIHVNAKPMMVHAAGALEQWDGQMGAGPTNAIIATDRAIQLAKQSGIACIALANTNHWMRGGYYAWHAAKSNCILIAWTNTIANMPTWGGSDQKLGNNPFVISVPYRDDTIVLDMAMSQFSHGKLQVNSRQNKPLTVPGGFDAEGNITTDATAILLSGRMIPTGYWKGAGMSLLLDIVAMILSGGKSVHDVSKTNVEAGVSQVFIAFDIKQLKNYPSIEHSIQSVIDDYLASMPINDKTQIKYPGQRVVETRKENLENGIPVEEEIWKEILALAEL